MQDRNKRILEFWDRGKELTIKNKEYNNFVNQVLSMLLKQDINRGDLTTNSLIKENKEICAVFIAKENGIFAGLEEFELFNRDLKIYPLKNDGDKIKQGEILIEIKGNARKILERERVSLNLLQRMSGIATVTNKSINTVHNKIKIAATRKTMFGNIDKKAVSIGGGLTHRLNLNDGIIIKDNHLKILKYDIKKSLELVKNKSRYIEIEVENREEALTSAKSIKKIANNKSLFAVMLDKIQPEDAKYIIKELKNQDLYENILFEASGNISPSNVLKYANTGVDVISMGYLTHSARVLGISQEIK